MIKMKKLKIWFMAWFQHYPFFRVIYKDGKRTTLLYEPEAKGLRDVFNGKLIIDYVSAQEMIDSWQPNKRRRIIGLIILILVIVALGRTMIK